jgi:hypothetical protein
MLSARYPAKQFLAGAAKAIRSFNAARVHHTARLFGVSVGARGGCTAGGGEAGDRLSINVHLKHTRNSQRRSAEGWRKRAPWLDGFPYQPPEYPNNAMSVQIMYPLPPLTQVAFSMKLVPAPPFAGEG